MHTIILQTALFGQDDVIDEALRVVAAAQRIARYDLRDDTLSDGFCDAVIAAVLAADAVITV
ncbi:MAG: hypothetical protein M0Z44_05095 [Gammaproteobacteria bacterium]|nr:hypothetical protein [Gammaproteobacteria bacterium]